MMMENLTYQNQKFEPILRFSKAEKANLEGVLNGFLYFESGLRIKQNKL
jgi:hypothetical protein